MISSKRHDDRSYHLCLTLANNNYSLYNVSSVSLLEKQTKFSPRLKFRSLFLFQWSKQRKNPQMNPRILLRPMRPTNSGRGFATGCTYISTPYKRETFATNEIHKQRHVHRCLSFMSARYINAFNYHLWENNAELRNYEGCSAYTTQKVRDRVNARS